jgi:hypothetical protein
MLVSAQSLATFLEQIYTDLSPLQVTRYNAHITTAGDRVRGALAALYTIPLVTRDANGNITTPLYLLSPISDPERTALGPVVKMLAACTLLDPARGIQPQEDRNSASRYCTEGSKLLEQLRLLQTFIAPLDSLVTYGIVASEALKSALLSKRFKSLPGIRQQTEGVFGVLHYPSGGIVEDV